MSEQLNLLNKAIESSSHLFELAIITDAAWLENSIERLSATPVGWCVLYDHWSPDTRVYQDHVSEHGDEDDAMDRYCELVIEILEKAAIYPKLLAEIKRIQKEGL